ncbi:MAG: MFS transporter [Proteobacteria bacterium]|nr:MFS transporter [Pseudomonadota bacterium]
MKVSDLFKKRGFLGLFISQATGAFNDNALKMILFGVVLVSMPVDQHDFYLSLLSALLVTPFVFFAPLAGWFSDRFSKRTVLLTFKATEFAILGLALAAIFMESLPILFILLILMGSQSAFYSPAKYGILKEVVSEKRLGQANGIIEMGTILCIILGTVGGSFLFDLFKSPGSHDGLVNPLIFLVIVSLTGFLATLKVEKLSPCTDERFTMKDFFQNLSVLKKNRKLRLTVAGICYFWFIAILLQMLLILFGTQEMGLKTVSEASLLFLFLSIGVATGSFVAAKLSRYKVELGLIPVGAIGMAIMSIILPSIAAHYFLVIIDLIVLGLFGGMFLVPLNTLLQMESSDEKRGQFIALANFFSNLGMLLSSLALYILSHSFQVSPANILLVFGLLTLAISVYIFFLLPEAFFSLVLGVFTRSVYRIRSNDYDLIPEKGGVLLTPNHMSFMDGLILYYAVPHRKVRFVVYRRYFDKPIVGWFLKMSACIPISEERSKDAILKVVSALDAGEVVCIFPEGSISRTGFTLPFKKGIELILRRSSNETKVLPVFIDKLWGSLFSFKGKRFFKKLPQSFPYAVTVYFGQPMKGKVSAFDLRQKVLELGSDAFALRRKEFKTLPVHFIRTARRFMFRKAVVDTSGKPLNYLKLLTASILLSRSIKKQCTGKEMVGIMLPASVAAVLSNVAVGLSGNIAVNLNFTAGDDAISKTIEKCDMKMIITSKLFVRKAKLNRLEQFVYIEDLMKAMSPFDRMKTLLSVLLLPSFMLMKLYCRDASSAEDTATVIFSSGSTGEPKGVELTHANVLSNGEMVDQILDFRASDRMLGSLPFFHSFGYSITFWLPLLKGIYTAFVPDPLDAKKVGEMAATYGSTVILGTPTFYNLYTRRCNKEQFKSLRIAIAGAERLSERMAQGFLEKFGVPLVEGYGATEMSPVISCNAPDYNEKGIHQKGTKSGSVGLALPGLSVKVVDPEDYDKEFSYGTEGMLLVKGPSRMKAYLNDTTRTQDVLHNGWYITGDIARIDEEGFIHIVGRLSRFSKIGGEMVPHVKIEETLQQALGFEEQKLVVSSVRDESKGEKLVVLHLPEATPRMESKSIMEKLKAAGLPNLWIPREFYEIVEFPLLASGKLDLNRLGKLATVLARK